MSTNAAFTAATSNAGNSFTGGTVYLTDDDGGNALFSMSAAKPGDTETKCLTVDYTGSLNSEVRLFGITTGTGLDAYLTLKITRGDFASPPGGGDCAGFTPDSLNYANHGAGVTY